MRHHEPLIISSSPHSLGVESRNGTPETKVTVYSPEEIRSTGKGTSTRPPVFTIGFGLDTVQIIASKAVNGDPFLGGPSKLSPTASDFTPGTSNGVAPLSLSGVQFLNATSIPDSHPQTAQVGNDSPIAPIGQRTPSDPNTPTKPARYSSFGTFTTGGVTRRAFTIKDVVPNTNPKEFVYLFNHHLFPSLDDVARFDLSIKGTVHVGFMDVRDAEKAFSMTTGLHPEWKLEYISPAAFAQRLEPRSVSGVSQHEGEVVVTARAVSPESTATPDIIWRAVEAKLEEFGALKALRKIYPAVPHSIEFIAEFFDVVSAINAVNSLNAVVFDGYRMFVYHHVPDLPRATEPRVALKLASRGRNGYYHGGFPSSGSSYQAETLPFQHYDAGHTPSNLYPIHGAIGQERGAQVIYDPYTYALSPRRRNKYSPRQRNSGSGSHNAVDIKKIMKGLDPMLKAIVDETSHGKYDFMYLRIDFANNCNVGYAFINFEDPYDIIDFVQARAGYRWNRFNSDKIAEVSYATIQGKDCLVQKFRNSSVMLEIPAFRPKLFHTGTGPLAGTEEEFPKPDNIMKMRRSVENAEHVGLFAPRAGQQFRDEQRRRRSQFDRGTRLAEIEDSFDYHWTPHRIMRRQFGVGDSHHFLGSPTRGPQGFPAFHY
ncbi:MAG: hypothetical protein M1834_000256 [Cirrosporium novae-zelandiae]|nr:MAG: hypothetical protein M1834_000256 [Cirrosporium novae-zelandiae]